MLDGPKIVLEEAAVLAAYRLPVQHGGHLPRLFLVHELHPTVFILHPLIAPHFSAPSRDGRVLGREVYAADLRELLQKMTHLRARVRSETIRQGTHGAP